jgi:hypothetical protein
MMASMQNGAGAFVHQKINGWGIARRKKWKSLKRGALISSK